MCKSKDVLPTDQLLDFVVILEKETTPKVLKKEISYDLVDFKKADKEINQWALNYKTDPINEKKLKSELLNHPKVVSVFTKAQFEELMRKKAKAGDYGSRKAKKQ